MNSRFAKGILFVVLGAACYGMLGIFIKKGGAEGYSTGELAFAQNGMGLLGLLLLHFFRKINNPVRHVRFTAKTKKQLILGGIPFGLTSTFYYLSLSYAPVSVSIVMLMQSVWIGTVIDYFVNGNKPSRNKIFAIIIILVGTVFATNLAAASQGIDWRGIFWGFMSALSYSGSLYVTNNVAKDHPPFIRSLYIIAGAFATVILVWGYSLPQQFDISVMWRWGFITALFGTILSPLFFTRGMPVVGIALGSILASIELPVAVVVARVFLGEAVSWIQWIGIILILSAVVLMNISFLKPAKSD